ncbi:hypothetical protein DFA_10961 [Cavenderia fasciculata]|uniref:Uncharacterized protein n=1 Tax=Cavenderia fasciculata TaxID=261658 RepID=F4QBW5_CACFS|nr:uncharacterized protein DFA_10961 [Cavenderia fasciculata]EGG14703.1 hypothetical protein DFA_10961 [Cavenderia fasciculata]|eukprot:XP_004351211.1 hypothetical protein DFA_10961 [Cavenderia fasciculata]
MEYQIQQQQQQQQMKPMSYFESDFYRKSQTYPHPFQTDPSAILANFKGYNLASYGYYSTPSQSTTVSYPSHLKSSNDNNTIFNFIGNATCAAGGSSVLPPYPFENNNNKSRSSSSPTRFIVPSPTHQTSYNSYCYPSDAQSVPSPTSSYTSSSAPASPVSSPILSMPQECKLGSKCVLCERGQPPILLKTPTWASIMKVVFYTLSAAYPEKEYFSLKTDVYEFMTSHWDRLYMNKKKSDNWRKQVQDMLSHSKNVFESGMDKIKQNGFWKLKTCTDPWQIRQLPSSSPVQQSQETPRSPESKKRSVEDYSSESDDLFDESRLLCSPKKRSVAIVDQTTSEFVQTAQEPLVEEIKVMREQVAKLSSHIQEIRQKLNDSPNEMQGDSIELELINEQAQLQFKLIQEKLLDIDKKEKALNDIVKQQQQQQQRSNSSNNLLMMTTVTIPSPISLQGQQPLNRSSGSLLDLLHTSNNENNDYTFDQSFNWSSPKQSSVKLN